MEEKKQHTLTWTVTDDMTAKRIGTAGAKILSTPNMLALMEGAALELAREFLDDGMTTVGAEAHVKHLAPTPVGMKVWATATLREIERRKTRRANVVRVGICVSWCLTKTGVRSSDAGIVSERPWDLLTSITPILSMESIANFESNCTKGG